MQKINRTFLFLVLTFGLSYGLAGLFYLISGGRPGTMAFTLMGVLYMFMPLVGALLVEKVMHKEPVVRSLGMSLNFGPWFLAAWILPLLVIALTTGLSLLLPQVHFSPDMSGFIQRYEVMLTPEQIEEVRMSLETMPIHPVWLALFSGLSFGALVNTLPAFGEELGWRGFLVKAFARQSFWKAAFWIGLIWGIWHAPLILMGHNYAEHPVAGVGMMTLWCILLSPLFLYVRLKTQSVWAAALMHGVLNALAGIPLMVVSGGNDLTIGVTGLSGFVALVLVIAALAWFDYAKGGKLMWGAVMPETGRCD